MNHSRGYALIVVLGVSMILMIGIGTMISFLAAAEKTSARQRLNREAFYVCDGISRVVLRSTVNLLADPLALDPTSTQPLEDQVKTAVQAELGANLTRILPPAYSVETDGFSYRDVDATETSGLVGAGRFAGLSGQRRRFTYDLALRKEGGSSCKTTATVDSMRIPFGELAVFSDEDLRFCPSWSISDTTRTARYHVNGDLTIGNVALPRVTLTGQLASGCGSTRVVLPRLLNVKFCVGEGECVTTPATLSDLTKNPSISTQVFSDGLRGTSELDLLDVSTRVQSGEAADGVAGEDLVSNVGNFRYLVDPGLPDDSTAVRATRLAQRALIRILDGVWYLNDGTTAWPGLPIWSDHPGHYRISSTYSPDERQLVGERDVGQDDVFSGRKPDLYSWYDHDNERGVVSYGRLTKDGGVYKPLLGGGSVRNRALRATRSGFMDVHWRRAAERNGQSQTGNILPMNFDLAEFINALHAMDQNELGDRLQEIGKDAENEIIVWIGSTWTGSTQGLTSSTSSRPTPLPDIADADSDANLASASLNDLAPQPYPTCKRTGDDDDDDDDDDDGHPDRCINARKRRINALRVYNGAARIPAGMRITIATHLPLYIQGSIDRNPPAPDPAVAAPVGLPGGVLGPISFDDGPDVFFAADSITVLSDDWEDTGWIQPGASPIVRSVVNPANPPIINASLLTGRTVHGSPQTLQPFGLERAVRFLERWEPSAASTSPIIAGSILIGFRSVHTTHPVCYVVPGDTRCAADAAWRHFWAAELASESRQPPGMPSFSLRGLGETIPDSMQINIGALFPFSFGL